MSAILFRMRKELKNQLLDMLRHPQKLIIYLFVAVMIGISFIGNMQADSMQESGQLDIRILYGVYFGALLFFFISVLLNGLNKGTTFFSMNDVNLLFVSPVSSKKILAYGLVKQVGKTLLMVVFLLCYGAMMANLFGLVFWQTMLLILGVAVTLFATQVFAMLVYGFVNGRTTASRVATVAIYAFAALPVAGILFGFLQGDSTMEALLSAVSSSFLRWMPFVGWIHGAVFGAINGNTLTALLLSGLTVLSVAGALFLFIKGNIDYYEDVLESTERVDQKRHAVKTNSQAGFIFTPKNIKVRKTGLRGGWGASAFFYKHLCEMRRRSRLLFLDSFTLVLLSTNIALGVFLNKSVTFLGGGVPHPTTMLMYACFFLDCYILFFSNMAGEWTREMAKHYVFIVPEAPFSKLAWSSLTTVLKPIVDGALIFTVLGLIFHASAGLVIPCILGYASVGLLYLSLNVLSQRVRGKMANKGLIAIAYIMILMLMEAPGLAGSVVVLAASGENPIPFLVALPMILWNVFISVVVISLCRNLTEIGLK